MDEGRMTVSSQGRGHVDNRPGLVDVRLPLGLKRRRLTRANVAAVCEQLGEHVSTRNVQKILGGSLRDISPLVRQWRESRPPATPGAADTDFDQVQAVGAIVINLIQDHATAMAEANEQAQVSMLDRVERLLAGRTRNVAKELAIRHGSAAGADAAELAGLRLDVRGLQADVRRLIERSTPAADEAVLPAELEARLQRLQEGLDGLRVATPMPDETVLRDEIGKLAQQMDLQLVQATKVSVGRLEALEALYARLERHLQPLVEVGQPTVPPEMSERLEGLKRQLVALTDQVQKLQSPKAMSAPPFLEPQTVEGFKVSLQALQVQLQDLKTPPRRPRTRPGLSKALTARLDALAAGLAELQAQRKPRKPAKKRPTKASAKRVTPAKRVTKRAAARKAVATSDRKKVSTGNSRSQRAATKKAITVRKRITGKTARPATSTKKAASSVQERRAQSKKKVQQSKNKPATTKKAAKRPAKRAIKKPVTSTRSKKVKSKAVIQRAGASREKSTLKAKAVGSRKGKVATKRKNKVAPGSPTHARKSKRNR